MTLPGRLASGRVAAGAPDAGAPDAGVLDAGEVGVVELPSSVEVWRVHGPVVGATGFNTTGRGNTRFAPIRDPEGHVVPTLYAGTTLEVALMETVLHDVPSPSAGFILTLDPRTEPRRAAQLRTVVPLRLADFTALGLRRLGLDRRDVIDSDKRSYPATRQLAEWLYARRPHLQGLWWTSRQDDRAQALLLFGTRLPPSPLTPVAAGQRFDQEPHLPALLGLLDRLGAGLHVG